MSNNFERVINSPNTLAGQGWMKLKWIFITLSMLGAMISGANTVTKFHAWIFISQDYGHPRLFTILQLAGLTLAFIWLLHRSLLMGGVDKNSRMMKLSAFFEPNDDDETTQVARGSYFGVDFNTGIIGITTAYATPQNKKRILYFESDVIESFDYDSETHHLILNLRNRRMPSLSIPVKDGKLMFRKIEQLAVIGNKRPFLRGSEGYRQIKEKLIEVGKMIEADY